MMHKGVRYSSIDNTIYDSSVWGQGRGFNCQHGAAARDHRSLRSSAVHAAACDADHEELQTEISTAFTFPDRSSTTRLLDDTIAE